MSEKLPQEARYLVNAIQDLPEVQKLVSAFTSENRSQLDVLGDIRKVFQEKGFVAPKVVFNELLRAEVSAKRIGEDAAKKMSAYFDASTVPEMVTGLAQKHRMPLTDEVARLYTRATGKSVVRIEGDIGNLGGLNGAMKMQVAKYSPQQLADAYKKYGIDPEHPDAKTKLSFLKANEAIGVMIGIVTDELKQPDGHIIGIRKGGDEIVYYVSGENHAHIKEALPKAQFKVQEFVVSSGLADIEHEKYKGQQLRRGVGIGLAEVELEKSLQNGKRATPLREQEYLDAMINHTKDDGGTKLHGMLHEKSYPVEAYKEVRYRDDYQQRAQGTAESFEEYAEKRYQVDLAEVRQQYEQLRGAGNPVIGADAAIEKYSDYKPVITRGSKASDLVIGKTPDETQYKTLEASLESSPNPAEKRLIAVTTDLAKRQDNVTNTPMYTQLRGELLPVFEAQHGAARMLHIDGSNVSGGNKLNSRLGDVMAREYAEQIKAALSDTELKELQPYLASHGGGRFSMLIPDNLPKEKVEALQQALSKRFDVLNEEIIAMDTELREVVQENLAAQKKLYPNGSALADNFKYGHVINPKTDMAGTEVTMAISKDVVRANTLEDTLKSLEAETRAAYQERIEGRQVYDRQSTGQQSGDRLKPSQRESGGIRSLVGAKAQKTQGELGRPSEEKSGFPPPTRRRIDKAHLNVRDSQNPDLQGGFTGRLHRQRSDTGDHGKGR